jgi:hypothetical protein
MGIFVDYPSNIFSGLNHVPKTIAFANGNVIWVTAIIVCNRTASPIRFFLQKKRVTGLTIEKTCYGATTANLMATYNNGTTGLNATLTNSGALAPFTVDGLTPALNSRILVKDQTTTFQNGIYTLSTAGTISVPWVLKRATDFDSVLEIQKGDAVYVSNGTTNGDTNWLQTSTITAVGTSPITFETNVATTIYYVNELEIAPYSTVDIVDTIGVLNLQYEVGPYISDRLLCFSNGYTQVFDCEVTCAQLNELPNF